MSKKTIKLVLLGTIVSTLLFSGCGISISRNYNNYYYPEKAKTEEQGAKHSALETPSKP